MVLFPPAARKMTCLIWQMHCKEKMYKWFPPLRTQEKLRKLELLAGMPRERSGPKKGKPSKAANQPIWQNAGLIRVWLE
ncbi:MAG: hypothetical protein M1536_03865 [Firmicutes bacterium]|nr:hypothetical protein [Bacillota bacterium]